MSTAATAWRPRLFRLFGLTMGVAAFAATVEGQYRGFRGFTSEPPRLASNRSFDGSFNFCRVFYQSGRREAGGSGWWTDYPSADVNMSIRLGELTKAPVHFTPAGEPEHVVVRLTDPELFSCPFVILEDGGTVRFTQEEVVALRTYLLKGGFLWADDFWGSRAWDTWTRALAHVLPPTDYPIVDITLDHPLFRSLFEVKALPQIPSINYWRRSGGGTSERGYDSAVAHIRGISDESGRLMVLMTHNTDIADGWEREGEDPDFFYRFSVDSYAVGINIILYAMTH